MTAIKLFQPPIVDLTDDNAGKIATVEIQTRQHKFSSDAAASGVDPNKNPIFGTVSSIDGNLISDIEFGLPIFRFKRGQTPQVKFVNNTGYTFNIHWHGLNTTADVDGASTEVVFGATTKIGTELDLNFPTINNNSSLLWLHAHPMFSEIQYIYYGLSGLLDIVDDESKSVTDQFVYGDNRILIKYQDLDLNSDGTLNSANLTTDENRSCFGAINGISCINWYSLDTKTKVPYVDNLEHVTSNNLVKVDILNASSSWRYIYVGVCDKNGKVRTFYQVQSDTGLMNPTLLYMISIAPANRAAILFDASQFPDGVANLFMYNFDLTEIFDSVPANPSNPYDPTLLGTIPDLGASVNATPYPTPIPDDQNNPSNQQANPSSLTYPTLPIIPQTTQVLDNGTIIPPQLNNRPYTIKKFLKIQWRPNVETEAKLEAESKSKLESEGESKSKLESESESKSKLESKSKSKSKSESKSKSKPESKSKSKPESKNENKSSQKNKVRSDLKSKTKVENKYQILAKAKDDNLETKVVIKYYLEPVLKQIKKVVFGETNYSKYKNLIMKSNFEYSYENNYLELLNKDYFYNLPSFSPDVPTRNIILFGEDSENSVIENSLGATEFCDGANRIMVDMWNSNELDLKTAMSEYNSNPNNYKPSVLPTCLLRITKQENEYSNIAMIGNDTLIIQFFGKSIDYNDQTSTPIASVTILFPPTPKTRPMNIEQWVELVNETFNQTKVTLEDSVYKLSDLLTLDWTFFPFQVSAVYDDIWYVKTVMMKTNNKSNYCVRFSGRWPLLQFFGKSLTGDTVKIQELNPSSSSSAASSSSSSSASSSSSSSSSSSIGSSSAPSSSEKKLEKKVETEKKDEIKEEKKVEKKRESILKRIKDKIAKKIKNKLSRKVKSKEVKLEKKDSALSLDMNIQTLFPQYATNDSETQIPILNTTQNAEIIIPAQTTFKGFLDGFDNDNLMTFAVKLDSSEQFIYRNGDAADSHPLHFHLTSGFANASSPYTSIGLLRPTRNYASYLYSREVYGIGPQQSIAFYLTFTNYSSNQTVMDPPVAGLGYQIHCHFMPHVSANSMMNKYFVYDGDRSDWF